MTSKTVDNRPPNYTASGSFLDDVMWKVRGQLAVLAALDEAMPSKEMVHGVHCIASELTDALQWHEERRTPWANPSPTEDDTAAPPELRVTLLPAAMRQAIDASATRNGRTPAAELLELLASALKGVPPLPADAADGGAL